MNYFHYKNNTLFAENIALTDIAQQFGTPCYIYSRQAIQNNWHAFNEGFGNYPHRICYAVKANSNIGVLNILAQLGSGFDIVSEGELERVLKAGGDPQKIVFSGVGKSEKEISRALDANIFCFDVESTDELNHLHEIAKQKNTIAKIALRINPNIDAKTHPYIATGLDENKFGIPIEEALPICHKIKSMPHIKLAGIACHIGSQLTELDPFVEAIESILNLIDQLAAAGTHLQYINFGGGLGVRYQHETPPSIHEYIQTLINKVQKHKLEIILEPGRAIVANAGILLTRVEYLKHGKNKNFAIVDAGMNDLIRPALYDAWQNIIPVQLNLKPDNNKNYDIVGPVCESADFLGKNRQLNLNRGDLLAICSAGAYGFSMSSNYNSRPKIAEIMIDGDEAHLIRQRETIADLFLHEKIVTTQGR
jgi:diaminopimelate decarboxylase